MNRSSLNGKPERKTTLELCMKGPMPSYVVGSIDLGKSSFDYEVVGTGGRYECSFRDKYGLEVPLEDSQKAFLVSMIVNYTRQIPGAREQELLARLGVVVPFPFHEHFKGELEQTPLLQAIQDKNRPGPLLDAHTGKILSG